MPSFDENAPLYRISIAHITPRDEVRLLQEATGAPRAEEHIAVSRFDGGYMIALSRHLDNPQEDLGNTIRRSGFSDAFVLILRLTRQHRCRQVLLDRQLQPSPSIPVHQAVPGLRTGG